MAIAAMGHRIARNGRVSGVRRPDEPVRNVSKVKEVSAMHRKRNVESSKKEQRNEVH
jgi:hypothetical protein